MTKMCIKSFFVLYTLFVVSIHAKHIDFKDCGNKEIKYIDIDPCDSSPCNIKAGNVYIVSIQFKASEDSSMLDFIGTATLPDGESFPLPSMNLCSQPGLCPFKSGSIVTSKMNVDIPGYVSPMNGVKINAELMGDGEIFLTCADFTVNIIE